MPGKSDFELRLDIALEEARDAVALRDAITGENGFVETYYFQEVDFGAAAEDFFIAGQPGLRGRVLHVSLYDVTQTFATTDLAGFIHVGTTSVDERPSDVDFYFTGDGNVDGATSITPQGSLPGTFNRYIPAGTGFNVHKTLAVDGALAGISKVAVTIAWMALES